LNESGQVKTGGWRGILLTQAANPSVPLLLLLPTHIISDIILCWKKTKNKKNRPRCAIDL